MVKIPGDNVGWPYHNFLQEYVFFARSFKSASYGLLRANSDKKMNVFAELHSGDSDEHNASAAQEGHHCSGYKAQDWTSIKPTARSWCGKLFLSCIGKNWRSICTVTRLCAKSLAKALRTLLVKQNVMIISHQLIINIKRTLFLDCQYQWMRWTLPWSKP